MELGVHQFRWHEQFHGIPWNLECANFDDISSSMKLLGFLWNLECANFDYTSNSMEFLGTLSAPISMIIAVSWKSMKFHGTWNAPISMTGAVPWNSIDTYKAYFNYVCLRHGVMVRVFPSMGKLFRWAIYDARYIMVALCTHAHGNLFSFYFSCLSCSNQDDVAIIDDRLKYNSWSERTFIFAHLSPIFLEDFIVYVLGGGGGGVVFY